MENLRVVPSFPDRPFPSGERAIALLMSGGVDSSVAALLLQRRGWEVVGLTMRVPDPEGRTSETGESAARVAAELGMPHFVVYSEEFFSRQVIAPFLSAYSQGLTPNPCADCNRYVKFGALVDVADTLAGRPVPVATGHYARVLRTDGSVRLARAVCGEKDQSYFLCDIRPERLERLYFPLGAYSKPEVRALAHEAGMNVAERVDSMEICFMSGKDYRKKLTAGAPGAIVDRSGRLLGRHAGIGRYTVGQRKGLGIASTEPLYVLTIDPVENRIVVGGHDEAFVRVVSAVDPNVLAPERIASPLKGKTRSRSPLAPCAVLRSGGALSVRFDAPQFAPAAGQRLVLYDNEDVLVASGTIMDSREGDF